MSRLIKLQATNIQKLKAVTYVFDENKKALVVCGDNAQGKTSFLLSLIWALCGQGAIPDNPIRQGQEEAESVVDLDTCRIKLNFRYGHDMKLKRPTLKVYPINNGKMATRAADRPQEILDALLCDKTMNPMDLIGRPPREIRNILVNLVDFPLDLDEHAKERKKLEDDRYSAGIILRQKQALVEEIPLPDDWKEFPEEPIDVFDLTKKYQDAVASNNENRKKTEQFEQQKSSIDGYKKDIEGRVSEIEMLGRDVEEADKQIVAAQNNVDETKAQIEKLVPVDTQKIENEILELQKKLDEGRKHNMENQNVIGSLNSKIDKLERKNKDKVGLVSSINKSTIALEETTDHLDLAIEQYDTLKNELDTLRDVDVEAIALEIDDMQGKNEVIADIKRHFAAERKANVQKKECESYTVKLKTHDLKLDDTIKSVKFPVPGLTVDVKGAIYNGRRLEQASTKEQIDIFTSLHLARKPKLRAIILSDAAVLDRKNMQALLDRADKEDFFVCCERIEEGENFEGASEIVIVDGEIKDQ